MDLFTLTADKILYGKGFGPSGRKCQRQHITPWCQQRAKLAPSMPQHYGVVRTKPGAKQRPPQMAAHTLQRGHGHLWLVLALRQPLLSPCWLVEDVCTGGGQPNGSKLLGSLCPSPRQSMDRRSTSSPMVLKPLGTSQPFSPPIQWIEGVRSTDSPLIPKPLGGPYSFLSAKLWADEMQAAQRLWSSWAAHPTYPCRSAERRGADGWRQPNDSKALGQPMLLLSTNQVTGGERHSEQPRSAKSPWAVLPPQLRGGKRRHAHPACPWGRAFPTARIRPLEVWD